MEKEAVTLGGDGDSLPCESQGEDPHFNRRRIGVMKKARTRRSKRAAPTIVVIIAGAPQTPQTRARRGNHKLLEVILLLLHWIPFVVPVLSAYFGGST